MKKIKLLSPILTTVSLSSCLLPLVSCNDTKNATHITIAGVGKTVEANDKYMARFFLSLDKEDYMVSDFTIKMIFNQTSNGEDPASNFTIEPLLNGSLLMLDITSNVAIKVEKLITFDLEISTSKWTNKINDCQIQYYQAQMVRDEWTAAFYNVSDLYSDVVTNYVLNSVSVDLLTNEEVTENISVNGNNEYYKGVNEIFYEVDTTNYCSKEYTTTSDGKHVELTGIINNIPALGETTARPSLDKVRRCYKLFHGMAGGMLEYNRYTRTYTGTGFGLANLMLLDDAKVTVDTQNRVTHIECVSKIYDTTSSTYISPIKHTIDITYTDPLIPTKHELTNSFNVDATTEATFQKKFEGTATFGSHYSTNYNLADTRFNFDENKDLVFSFDWTGSTFANTDKLSYQIFIDDTPFVLGLYKEGNISMFDQSSITNIYFDHTQYETIGLTNQSIITVLVSCSTETEGASLFTLVSTMLNQDHI